MNRYSKTGEYMYVQLYKNKENKERVIAGAGSKKGITLVDNRSNLLARELRANGGYNTPSNQQHVQRKVISTIGSQPIQLKLNGQMAFELFMIHQKYGMVNFELHRTLCHKHENLKDAIDELVALKGPYPGMAPKGFKPVFMSDDGVTPLPDSSVGVEESHEHEKKTDHKEPQNKCFAQFNTLIIQHGLPRTSRLLLKLKEYEEDRKQFKNIKALIAALSKDGVPTDSLRDQSEEVFTARKGDSSSNFANAIIIVDMINGPVIKTTLSGSRRVGNSIYAFPVSASKRISKDIEQSQNDSEVGLFQSIHNELFANEEMAKKLSKYKARVYIRIMSNMGPCDGCKRRLELLKEKFIEILKYNGLVVDVHYASPPGKAANRVNSTYGWKEDDICKSGMREGLYAHTDA